VTVNVAVSLVVTVRLVGVTEATSFDGAGVGVGIDVEFTVTETALEAGEVTGVEALSVTLQVIECEPAEAV
jgi:hypothetical protein